MKKIGKRLSALLLAVCISALVLPMGAMAAGGPELTDFSSYADLNKLASAEITTLYDGASSGETYQSTQPAINNGIMWYRYNPLEVEYTLLGHLDTFSLSAPQGTFFGINYCFEASERGKSVDCALFNSEGSLLDERWGNVFWALSLDQASYATPAYYSASYYPDWVQNEPLLIVLQGSDGNGNAAYRLVVVTVNAEEGVEPVWQSVWNDVLKEYYGIGLRTSDANVRAAQKAEESAFWNELTADVGEVATGTTLTLNTIGYDEIPYWVVDALAGKDAVLKLTYFDADGNKQTVEIDCLTIPKAERNRVFYPIVDFAALYGKAE